MTKKKSEPGPWIASMGSDQLEKRLAWLDEGRRSEAEAVARLRERVDLLEENRAKATSQLKELASELTRLSTIASRINHFDESLAKHRQEISRHLEQAEKRRTDKETRLEDLRKRDQTAISKDLSSLRSTFSRIDEVEHALEARREEEIRLTRSLKEISERLNELSTREEDQGRGLATLEEGRRQDAFRVAEVQQELADLRTKVDALHGVIDSSSDRIRRLEVQIAELTSSEQERAEGQVLFLEQQAIKMADFERSLKEWRESVVSFEAREVRLDDQAKVFDESLRSLKQARAELDAMLERLERRIAEISEIQRLAEDRVRQEWSSFQADDQKRWSGYKLTFDERWREHDRLHERMTSTVETQGESLLEASNTLEDLAATDRQRLMDLLALVREWASEIERRGEEVS
jgi:chromosome segregation ATPase